MPLKYLLERRIITGANGIDERFIRRLDGRLKERLDGREINVAGGFIHSIHLIQIGGSESLQRIGA
jgi:hypothetical protein